MKLKLHRNKLFLKYTFAISRRSFDSLESLVVEIEHEGISGYGEATHNPFYENTDVNEMILKLESLRGVIEEQVPETPESFWLKMHALLLDFPFALCALDVAMHDWFARKNGLALHKYWGLELGNLPKTSYTLGIDIPENMIKRLEEVPWDCCDEMRWANSSIKNDQ